MIFSANELASNTTFFKAMRIYARQMTAMFAENPRMSSIFASQQRWLMAQLGLSLHYGRDPADPTKQLYAGRFVSKAIDHGIASRNTAATFIQEMLAYRFVRASDNPPDNRMRPLEPTDTAVQQVVRWLYAHLAILDTLDGGNRAVSLTENPALFTRLQPIIALGLLENHGVRNPGETFNLFTWANSGGVVMDYFISMITEFDPDAPRTMIGPVSSADICQSYMISKTHLKRLMSKAAEMGSVSFETVSRRNMLWLSQGFVKEYWIYQAEKFAIIDAAFHAEAASPVPGVRQLTAVP
ncbi:hypothetical protein [Rhizobium herbae]|uniref:MarR family transcriptional regulator n=1 Tax=Rhizobium herbae TaxID=508661 RepID=A0ABS4ESS1_9HYPH|nr:hypothetical protein [Rhizobium herbae]MBP1860994.1 hypothetical protein [Rhizobium herbae]